MKAYSFAVDYDQPFSALIKEVPFTWVCPEINEMCFDFVADEQKSRAEIMDGKVFDFGAFSLENFDCIIGKLKKFGCRPGTARELLSYCRSQRYDSLTPNKSALLVSIGSFCKAVGNGVYILGVDIFDCEYDLNLFDLSQEVDRPVFAVRI